MNHKHTEDPEIELGVIGVSDGNGHPYSFASIINGYDPAGFANTCWSGILEYLEERDTSEFGFDDVRVTHAWTQDETVTEQLCAAARIPHSASERNELIGLDGVLLLRDDYETHLEMARPFLDAGMAVFVDKPLALDVDELQAFSPYLRNGQLMSCSGLRFARELDGPRSDLDSYGPLQLIRGAVLYDLPRYGIHVIEAIFGMVETRPIAVTPSPGNHASLTIETEAGYPIQIDALGDIPPTFHIDIYGADKVSHHELQDNFQAFRRTLWRFINGIRAGEVPLDPEETLDALRVLIAGQRAQQQDRRVELEELSV